MEYCNLQQELLDFHRQNGVAEQDFFCKKCGKFMLALDELVDVIPIFKHSNVYLVHNGKMTQQYHESEGNRWLVIGKYIKELDKRFFRTICWDCFFKELRTVFDVDRKARKGKWAAKVQKEDTIPCSWTATAPWFKLVFNMDDTEYLATKKKLATASREHFIGKYGIEEGLERFKAYSARQSYTCSKEYMMKEKGMTEEEWHDYNKSRASTKENYFRRYGEVEGLRRWQEYCAHEAYAGNSMEWFIGKLGEEEGKKRYEETCRKKTQLKCYSNISQRLFKEIDIVLGDFAKESRWELKNHELEVFTEVDGMKKMFKTDYFLKGKVIEFNGDLWHANPNFYGPEDSMKAFDGKESKAKDIWERDATRRRALEKLGFQVLVVWENDYMLDANSIVKQCIDFLKT